MAPKRLPWSVSAIAGNSSALAFSTSFSSWAAPSSRLYSEWTWRWTKSAPPMSVRPPARRSSGLFPLDGAGGLRRDIEHHAVDPLHLVDDAARDLPEEIVGQVRPVRRHGVLTHHRPQRDDLGIGAEVAHDPHRADWQQHGEGLPELALKPCRTHLLLHHRIRLPQEHEPLLGDLAQHADREPRSREGLTPDDLGGQAEQRPPLPHLVLEQLPERLHEPELHPGRQPAHVVVGLDGRRRPLEGYRFDHVGIEGALGQPRDVPEPPRLFLEDRDVLGPDSLPLGLGVDDATNLVKKPPTCI